MVQVDHIDEIFIKLLVERLGWPVKLVRWQTARSIRELLRSKQWKDATTTIILDWIGDRRFESEVSTALSALLVTEPALRPTFDAISQRIQRPSLLSDMLLERMYGPGFIHGGWQREVAEPPAAFSPDRYFESHKTQDVPVILSMNFSRLEEKHGLPFTRQWAFEWQRVQERSSAPYSDYPYYFGDFSLARLGLHPQCITRQSEVLRSAYQRTLAHAVVAWGMPMSYASFYITDTLPVLPGLFEVDPAPAPTWLGALVSEFCAEDAELETLARSVLAASQVASEGALLALTVPTPREVAEFGEVTLMSYFVSQDFQAATSSAFPDLQEFVVPDAFSLRGDVTDCDLSRWKSPAEAGVVMPTTFAAIPALHGTWHDEYIGAGLRIPCSYCFDTPTKLDADSSGLKVLDEEHQVARTKFWRDAWTPINMPSGGGTRIGVASYVAPKQLESALTRLSLTLAWQVRVITYDTESSWDKLQKKERLAFFRL